MAKAAIILICVACVVDGLVVFFPPRPSMHLQRRERMTPRPRMAQSNEDRKAAIAAAQAKKAATVKKRQAAIDALRAWAALSRKKQALAKQEEENAARAASRPRKAVTGKAAVQPSPASLPAQQMPPEPTGLLETYRELAVTKAKLAFAKKQNEMKRAVESARQQLPGGGEE